jgi:hypothetical protein
MLIYQHHDGTVRDRTRRGPLKTEHTYHLNMNSPSMRHSEIPALLLGSVQRVQAGEKADEFRYLQFFVNAAVVFFVLYLAVQFVLTVRRDVQDKMAEASIGMSPCDQLCMESVAELSEILQEISECSQLYLTNRCDPSLRVPAM